MVVSKDEDFLGLAMRPGDSGRLLWIRTGNCRTAPLLGLLWVFFGFTSAHMWQKPQLKWNKPCPR